MSKPSVVPPGGTTIPEPSSYRPEVDGLRCIAVMVVILYHAGFNAFAGGYVGVDVFFVISGYLITSILTVDLASGNFSIRKFYERRARRIFPALFLVMSACVPLAWVWLTPGQLREFFQSVIAVTLFLSNMYFWLKSGYFGTTTETLPLLHTWSLSVEEQFYVIFPLVLLLLWRYWRARLQFAIALFGTVSLACCLWLEIHNPLLNFFLAPTRAWELLAGSFVALRNNRGISRSPSSTTVDQLLSGFGIVLIGVAVFDYTKSTSFPGRYAIAPVLGTVLILASCTPKTMLWRLLSVRPVVGIGLLSYSAYLWHQPIFAFTRIVLGGEPSKAVYGGLIILIAGLSYLSWRYVERPFRDRKKYSRQRIFGLAAVISIVFMGLGISGHFWRGFPGRFDERTNILAATAVASPKRATCHTEGLDYLRPSLACRYLGQNVNWVVLGDSHGVELAWALAEALRRQSEDQGLLQLTSSGCQPALTFLSNVPGCSKWLQEAVSLLEAEPQLHTVVLVFRHSFYLYGDQLQNFPTLPDQPPSFLQDQPVAAARAAYWTSFAELVRRLQSAGKRVLVIEPIPELGTPVDRLIYLRDLVGDAALNRVGASTEWYERRNWGVLTQLAALPLTPTTQLIRSRTAFCAAQTCMAIIDGESMYFDDNHLSIAGARRLVKLVIGNDGMLPLLAVGGSGKPAVVSPAGGHAKQQ